MIKERNKEIEAIIEKLGDETHSTQKTLMTQYEAKVAKLNEKHKVESEEYQVRLQQLKDKLLAEQETRTMLDENLRVLGRRTNDMEIELADKKDKVMTLERANVQSKAELDSIYDEQTQIRVELEQQMRLRIDEKDKDLRKVKEDAQERRNKTEAEIEMLKIQNRNELELIQEKVAAAMNKKKDVIEELTEELRLKDLQVMKLKEMMDKQRKDFM